MKIETVEGDLLDQKVEAIVNAWNRNFIPWFLLWPHGVSGAIKKRAGFAPFGEIGWRPIPLGGAVLTGAGRLQFKGIIHVAGINAFWRASEFSIRQSVRSAVDLAAREKYESLAMPIIGSGAGNFSAEKALAMILDELGGLETDLRVVVVRFER